MKVCKFGGTSMADARQVKKVADIIMQDKERRVIVVSAPKDADTKTTDLLIRGVEKAKQRESGKFPLEVYSKIKDKLYSIATGLELNPEKIRPIISDLEQRVEKVWWPKDEYRDHVASFGEDASAKIISYYINDVLKKKAIYLNPKGMLIVSDDFENAKVLPESYGYLKNLKHRDEIIIFPGFFGFTKDGKIATFKRNGSNITATTLAYSLDAELYENWTDVDGIYVANPKIIPNAEVIKQLTYEEGRELMYAGDEVLQKDCIIPLKSKRIPINVRNTNNPGYEGTMILSERTLSVGPITGIAHKKGFYIFNLRQDGMNDEVGLVHNALGVLAKIRHKDKNEKNIGISFEHSGTEIDGYRMVIHQEQINKINIEDLCHEIKKIGINVEYMPNMAIICVVGHGMSNPKYYGKVDKALGEVGINLVKLQTSGEINVIRAVKEEHAIGAVHSIYKEFFS